MKNRKFVYLVSALLAASLVGGTESQAAEAIRVETSSIEARAASQLADSSATGSVAMNSAAAGNKYRQLEESAVLLLNENLQHDGKNKEYEYYVYDSYVELRRYIGPETENGLKLPEEIGGLPVKVLNLYDLGVSDVYLPDNVSVITSIRSNVPCTVHFKNSDLLYYCDKAFGGYITNTFQDLLSHMANTVVPTQLHSPNENTDLEDLVLPDQVIAIADGAFSFCNNIRSIDCNNVTTIGEEAFACCLSLEKIDLGKTSGIGLYTFTSGTHKQQVQGSSEQVLVYDPSTSLKQITVSDINCSLTDTCLPEEIAIYGPANSKALEYAITSGSDKTIFHYIETDA